MNGQTQTNHVTLSGKVVGVPVFSHEVFGEKFYEVSLEVKRLSDMADIIPVSVSERLMSQDMFSPNSMITVNGQFRSYNKIVDGKSKLMLTVFVKDVCAFDNTINSNNIFLEGFICKPPVFRTTPFNREICDVLLAVNRQYNKSDYIPCIAWGRNARYVKTLPIGAHIAINGRVQSRQYQKRIDENTVIAKTAYEVSVSKVTCINDNTLIGENSDVAQEYGVGV